MMRFLFALWLLPAVAFAVNWDGSTGNCFFHNDSTVGLCHPSDFCFDESVDWTTCIMFRVENSTDDDCHLVSKADAGGAERQFMMRTDQQAAPTNIEVYSNGFGAIDITGGNVIALDNWYLTCVSHDGGTSTMTMWTYDLETRPPTVKDDGLTGLSSDESTEDADVRVGGRGSASCNSDEMFGDTTFVSYFAAEFTQQDVLNYAYNPLKVRAQKSAVVKWFLPLGDATSGVDWGGRGQNFSLTGSAALGDSPPVGGQ